MQDVVQLRPQSPSRAILVSPKPSEVCGTEEGLPILSRPLAEETRVQFLAEIREIEHLLSSTHTSKEIDRARMMMASSMPASRSDEGDAALEAAAWSIVLGDEEMNGRIPGWVIETVAKEFMRGERGRFFPKATDFMLACKSVIARHRWAIVERRRLLDAKVIRPPAEASGASQRVDLTESLNRMFPGTTAKKRLVEHDDGWEDRRATVVAQMAEMEARRLASEQRDTAE